LHDPDFETSCAGQAGNCGNAWGLRVINSQNILVYGAGLYSFFDDYSTSKYLYLYAPCLITDKRSALGWLKC